VTENDDDRQHGGRDRESTHDSHACPYHGRGRRLHSPSYIAATPFGTATGC
jgi:hypothetical protein